MNNVGKDVLVGFDTEGSIKVLQLFFDFGDCNYTIVFQLNHLIRNNTVPEEPKRLLTSNYRLHGKKVNEKLVDIVSMCGTQPPTIARILQTRSLLALIHATKNPFITIEEQRQEDLGLKTIFHFFSREKPYRNFTNSAVHCFVTGRAYRKT